MNAARLRVFVVAGVCSLALFVTGCARNAQKAGGESGSETVLVCRTEKPTGSHIPQRICHEQQQTTDRRQSDQDKVFEIQRRDQMKPIDANTRQ